MIEQVGERRRNRMVVLGRDDHVSVGRFEDLRQPGQHFGAFPAGYSLYILSKSGSGCSTGSTSVTECPRLERPDHELCHPRADAFRPHRTENHRNRQRHGKSPKLMSQCFAAAKCPLTPGSSRRNARPTIGDSPSCSIKYERACSAVMLAGNATSASCGISSRPSRMRSSMSGRSATGSTVRRARSSGDTDRNRATKRPFSWPHGSTYSRFQSFRNAVSGVGQPLTWGDSVGCRRTRSIAGHIERRQSNRGRRSCRIRIRPGGRTGD